MGMSDNLDNPPPDPPTKSSKSGGGDFDWKELLNWRVGLCVVFIVFGFWLHDLFSPDRNEVVNYSNSNVQIDVSDTLNEEAVNRLGVDLTDNLDPKLIPVVVADAMKEAIEDGVSEAKTRQEFAELQYDDKQKLKEAIEDGVRKANADFIPSLVSKISNMIYNISTIDLNADGLTDPILVIPASASSDQEFIQFSIKVPDPAEVSELPPGSDQEAWRDIAENKSIEIMTVSATKNAQDELYMQSAPNHEMYGSAPPYYHYSSPGLGTMLLTSMTMSALFSPPFIGYGEYYSRPPATVSMIQSQRSSFTASMGSSNPSQSAVTNSKGQSVGQSNFKKIPPKSLNQVKTAQFRAASANRSGGFGSAKSSSSTRRSSGSSGSRRR
jgi:hypothetical protein